MQASHGLLANALCLLDIQDQGASAAGGCMQLPKMIGTSFDLCMSSLCCTAAVTLDHDRHVLGRGMSVEPQAATLEQHDLLCAYLCIPSAHPVPTGWCTGKIGLSLPMGWACAPPACSPLQLSCHQEGGFVELERVADVCHVRLNRYSCQWTDSIDQLVHQPLACIRLQADLLLASYLQST